MLINHGIALLSLGIGTSAVMEKLPPTLLTNRAMKAAQDLSRSQGSQPRRETASEVLSVWALGKPEAGICSRLGYSCKAGTGPCRRRRHETRCPRVKLLRLERNWRCDNPRPTTRPPTTRLPWGSLHNGRELLVIAKDLPLPL